MKCYSPAEGHPLAPSLSLSLSLSVVPQSSFHMLTHQCSSRGILPCGYILKGASIVVHMHRAPIRSVFFGITYFVMKRCINVLLLWLCKRCCVQTTVLAWSLDLSFSRSGALSQTRPSLYSIAELASNEV